MAVAQRNNWNVSNAEVSSTKPFLSSSWEVQIQAAAAHRAQPQCTFQWGMPTASLLRAGSMIYIGVTLSASCTLSGATQHQKLPVWKLITKATAMSSSSKFYNWPILILFGMDFWQAKCLWTLLKSLPLGVFGKGKDSLCRWWRWDQQHWSMTASQLH